MEHQLHHPSAPSGESARVRRTFPGFNNDNHDLPSPTPRRFPENTEAPFETAPTVETIAASIAPQAPLAQLLLRLLAGLALALVAGNLLSQAFAELPAKPEEIPTISDVPLQSKLTDMSAWKNGDYLVQPLAGYDVTARVLSARGYDQGRESEVSQVDFALGWGSMADRELLSKLNVQQRDRWYFVRWRGVPIKAQDVIANSANTHTIASSPEVAEQLAAVQPGDVVRLQGYLVKVAAEDGWSWTSSTARTDTGDGSCEVLWVESVEIFADAPIAYASID
jgi:hypothetical protein